MSLLFESLAHRISQRLDSDKSWRPEGITALAREYGAAYKTMWKAVKVLSEAGKLRVHRGSRMCRTDLPKSVTPPARQSPAARLAQKLRGRIVGGDFPVGEALPKCSYFVIGDRVARSTVGSALRVLADQDLIHKAGKQWIVGPRQQASHARGAVRAPVVILLTNDEYSAYKLYGQGFFAPFVNQFNTELVKRNVRVVFMHYNPPLNPESIMPWGIETARSLMPGFGDRYLGAIIVDQFLSVETCREWARVLSAGGAKPVVYFESTGTAGRVNRDSAGLKRNFFCLRFDETAAVTLALRGLARAGHRRVAYATLDGPGWDWSMRRLDRAVSLAAELVPPVQIVPIVHNETFWDPSGESDVDKFATFNTQLDRYLREKETAAPPVSKKTRTRLERVLAQTPTVAALLDSGATAVISANDRIAHLFWLFAKAAGIPIPGRLSMISFDNLPESIFFPITTVDFGFARLGYLAAHILLDDLPASADRQGTIAGIPQLVERGSVGPPAGQCK